MTFVEYIRAAWRDWLAISPPPRLSCFRLRMALNPNISIEQALIEEKIMILYRQERWKIGKTVL